MRLRLIRHATLRVQVGGKLLLIDPMLDPAGAREPVEDTPNPRRNPLVELPEPPAIVVGGIDGIIVTHLHQDHLDATAIELLPKDVPLFCQPPDAATLRGHGFGDVRPVDDAVDFDGLRIARTGGQHGTGEIAQALAPVSGFALGGPGGLYVAGDTIWCEAVRAAIAEHRPAAIIVNASGARFLTGDPIVMTTDDVVAVARHAPQARVIAVHLEAINHCLQTRADLHQRLRDERLTDQVTVPEDGAEVPLS